MSELQNLYEVRKTVRFAIEPQFDKNLIKPKKSENLQSDLNSFILKYDKLISNFHEIFFYNNKLNSKLKIKFSFLKNHTKKEFYENDIEKLIKFNLRGIKSSNQIEVGNSKKLDYLFEVFSNFEKENRVLLEKIRVISSKPEENQARKSDLGQYFNELTKRTNFEFIRELFNDNIGIENKIDISKKIDETKKITLDLQKLILNIQKTLLPNESIGQVIEKASFNYYTVNKRKKDYEKNVEYFENSKKKLLKEFNTSIFNKDGILNEEGYGFKKFISEITDNVGNIEIEKAYNLMKEYKAEQKSNFLEFLAEKSKGNESNLDISLFDDIFKEKNSEKFKNILNLTIAILLLSKIKSDTLNFKDTTNKQEKEEEIQNNLEKYNNNFGEEFGKVKKEDFFNKITELKKDRGQYFFEGNKNMFVFKKYGNFCDKYKKVAIEIGRIKANIKGLEKEKIDAEKTQSWALILEKDENKYLLTIPRNKKNNNGENFETNLQKAKKEIENLEKTNSGELILYKFESLTLRALDKLCFGKENNTFAGNIAKELFEQNNTLVDKKIRGNNIFYNLKRKDEIGDKDNNIKNDKSLITFYKTVLSLRSTQNQIIITHFKDFNTFINSDFENLENFERELKKTCYIKESFHISESKKEEIIKNFEAKLYKITSYDLAKNDKDFFQSLGEEKKKTGLKRHKSKNKIITNIWLNFWKIENENHKYPLRLNPEISISFLESVNSFTQNNSGLKYNRKFNDRYLLTTTITQNALEKSLDLSFKEKSDIEKVYKNYNEEFNKSRNNMKYFYGLDRGENELVSLGIFDLSKVKNEDKGVKIKVYELEKECFGETNEKGVPVYKNLSYFQFDTNPEFYKEKEVSCIDLTTSKLINGKIYLNGDITTYLNLKLIAAKRKIYETVSQKFSGNEEFEFIDIEKYKIIKLKSQEGMEYIYKFDNRYESIFSFEDTKEKLEKYLKKVQENLSDNEEVSIQKVNNLRDAICANMIGIIAFLNDIFSGMIILEDLTINWKNDTFDKSNTTLSSRFEQKLLQKFSSLNLVPPTYKQILSIKDENNTKIKQLGIIGYVDEAGTSTSCPKCEKKLFGHGKGPDFENSMHHYREDNGIDYGDYLEEAKKTKNDDCDYHMKNNNHGFNYITSGDDLATYNIAKKGLQYINSLKQPGKKSY